ncbi:hypothetical protein G9U52_31000 [Paenibacillus sp. S3N08]|uniref:Cell envelope-related transcriptional attenuator domain-containing protein n=1 Tax=Paenibacillus agricola TaxID=2716264 RepID=A0ABX0JG52_9BACL|nr:hypothetical protein [Paenibacillus agricola]
MLKKLKWTLLSLSLLLVGGIGYYTYAFMSFANNIQSKPETTIKKPNTLSTQNVSKNIETYLPPKWEGKQRVNLLILGGDSRGLKQNEVPRSDSLIVASIDPVTKKAHLFSIMRDTYVKIPGYGEDRINAAYALGGPNLTMKTVGDLLGIPIQYYVYTDFKGFIALVDAIDGIEMDVEKDMKYSDSEDGPEYDINLKKGLQHLNGTTALQYVRFRHDAMSDFSRTERQRNFIQAVVKKMQSTSSLLKLPWILSSIDPYIETNLSTTDMIKLGSLGYEAKTEGMTSQQIPPFELLQEKKVGGADVIGVNRDKLQAFIKALLEKPDPNAPPVNEMNNNEDNSIEVNSVNGASPLITGRVDTSYAAANKPAVTPKPAPVVSPTTTKKPASGSTSGTTNKPAASTGTGSTSGVANKPAAGAGTAANSANKPTTSSGSTSSTAGKPASGTAADSANKPTTSSTSGTTTKSTSGQLTKPVADAKSDSNTKTETVDKLPAGTAANGTSKSTTDQTAGSAAKPVTGASSADSSSKPASSPATGSSVVKPSAEAKPATSTGSKLEAEATNEAKPATSR